MSDNSYYIRPYLEDWDYSTFMDWHKQRGIPYDTKELIPKTGWVAPEIAMIFLVTTNTKCAFVENLITNPTESIITRGKVALSMIDRIRIEAKLLGFTHLCVLTEYSGIRTLAEGLGGRVRNNMAVIDGRI